MIRFAIILESPKPRGAATRALRALLKACWRSWGLRCVEARIEVQDATSAEQAAAVLHKGE